MKKRCALMLALALLVCMISGCGKKDPFEGIPNPEVTIELSNGDALRFELYVHEAPNTVANFIELAQSGFYNGMSFFRVVPSVLVQTGDPNNDGTGHADYAIQGEFKNNGIENNASHQRGAISMCRQEEVNDSASTQFFIMLGSYPEYDNRYAAFGMAEDAATLEALDRLAYVNVDQKFSPLSPVAHIVRVEVNTHGYEYEAAKMKFPETTKAPESEEEEQSN